MFVDTCIFKDIILFMTDYNCYWYVRFFYIYCHLFCYCAIFLCVRLYHNLSRLTLVVVAVVASLIVLMKQTTAHAHVQLIVADLMTGVITVYHLNVLHTSIYFCHIYALHDELH